jgi:hypothetical protein
MSLSGTIRGASSVVAEIDKVYVNQIEITPATGSSYYVSTSVINSTVINQIKSDLTTLMNTDASLATELATGLIDKNGNALTVYNATLNPTGTFHLQPGAVIEATTANGSAGNITVSSAMDLSPSALNWRFGPDSEPGTLTLRAAGNLSINANIVDHPTAVATLYSTTVAPSWNINLVAGANTLSANPMAVIPAAVAGPNAGTLTIANGKGVYTESGSIGFASGGDTVINYTGISYTPGFLSYNIGTYSGSITGDVGRNLTLSGGVIQSAVGNIDIDVGGDLTLAYSSSVSSSGTIRTTGQHAVGAAVSAFSTYAGGGSIYLDVGGDVTGMVTSGTSNWLTITTTKGIDQVYAKYSSSSGVQGIAAMAGGDVYVRAGGNFLGQAGTFGAGNLSIYSGGNLEGLFLVRGDPANANNPGIGTLVAMGNFGIPEQISGGLVTSWAQLVEMFNARVSVTAQGNVEIGAVLNPTSVSTSGTWSTYTPDSSISLTSVTGDVNIYGSLSTTRYGSTYAASAYELPAVVDIAARGNINISGIYNQLAAANGDLSMTATEGNIVFLNGANWTMPGVDPVTAGSVTIFAGGDIENMSLTVPMAATIRAGGNITDLTFNGQNNQTTDVTTIQALGNITYGYTPNTSTGYIQLAGPGYLVVEAGGSIDLGGSNRGIQAVGNYQNSALGSSGSIIVAAGFTGALNSNSGSVLAFFDALQAAGNAYTPLLQSDPAAAQAIIDQTRANVIATFFTSYGAHGGGDITLTSSQISTTGGGSISVLATGEVNVGKDILASSTSSGTNTGIFTSTGGAVNVFATGDVNVNESRVMTFQGGDITMWSDQGNIYAGKGNKDTVNAGVPKYVDGTLTFITPPTVGSGIRAMTYAPGENTPAPAIGNLNIFTPSGFVDAGEAGISGGNLVIGAMYGILNVANISFTGQAVGLPPAAQTLSLGALTGTTNLGEKTIVSQDSGALGSARGSAGNSALQATEEMVKWFEVRFISFDLTSPVAGGEESGGHDEKKD